MLKIFDKKILGLKKFWNKKKLGQRIILTKNDYDYDLTSLCPTSPTQLETNFYLELEFEYDYTIHLNFVFFTNE